MSDVTFTIERTGFPTITLDTEGGGPYGLQVSSAGLGVAPVSPRFLEGAGNGGIYQGERVGMRPLDLGVIILGEDRLHVGELIRDIANLVRARKNKPLPKLVATYNTGEVFELPFVYVSGLELDYTEALPTMYRAQLSLMCPDPFWTARDAVTFTIQNNALVEGLLPDLAELHVMASSAIGTVPISNPGDVEADVTWRITGPGGPVTVQVDGIGFVYDSALAEEEVVIVDGRQKTVLDQDNVSQYANLGTAPKFPTLPAGPSNVFISMTDAVSGVSSVTGFYKPRREVIF